MQWQFLELPGKGPEMEDGKHTHIPAFFSRELRANVITAKAGLL